VGGPLLRPAARGIILDDEDRVLLCRFEFSEEGVVVWATPGGGVEAGESPRHALRRELAEEIGLTVTGEPPHVWHQRVVAPGHAAGYDGIINDYFLIRTPHFSPSGSLSAHGAARRARRRVPLVDPYRTRRVRRQRRVRTPRPAHPAGRPARPRPTRSTTAAGSVT
jgi:8-oxo-dGTP pyrophosphatase MutT (NUDIX family)